MKISRSGFTIVELLIAIVVIAILAAISVASYTGIQNRAYDSAVQNDLRQFAQLVELYNAEYDSYPRAEQLATLGVRVSKSAYGALWRDDELRERNFIYCTPTTENTYGILARSKSGQAFQHGPNGTGKISADLADGVHSIHVCNTIGLAIGGGVATRTILYEPGMAESEDGWQPWIKS